MDDLIITKCEECKTSTYRYNYQPCPICSDRIKKEILEQERQREKERLDHIKELNLKIKMELTKN